jgi:hypothetical protein
MPLQLLEGTGSKITIYVYPRVLFRFMLQTAVDDAQLAVQGGFEVTNYSFTPYRAGKDGLVVPLPRGFKGGILFDSQDEVAVAAGEGFRIIRPLPPVTGRKFRGGFTLSVEGGKVEWAQELPMGALQSQLAIRKTPDMIVHTPSKVPSEIRKVPEGTYVLVAPISILPKQSLALSIEGLPAQPAWRIWLPRLTGVLVVAVMLAGLYFALTRKPPQSAAASAASAAAARRQRLLDELVELERTGQNPRRRDQLLAELEDLWS